MPPIHLSRARSIKRLKQTRSAGAYRATRFTRIDVTPVPPRRSIGGVRERRPGRHIVQIHAIAQPRVQRTVAETAHQRAHPRQRAAKCRSRRRTTGDFAGSRRHRHRAARAGEQRETKVEGSGTSVAANVALLSEAEPEEPPSAVSYRNTSSAAAAEKVVRSGFWLKAQQFGSDQRSVRARAAGGIRAREHAASPDVGSGCRRSVIRHTKTC